MLLPLLFVLLTAFGGATAFGLAMKERRRRDLPAPSTRPALTSGSGDDSLLERSIRELRPGDILTIDNKDFLCEGVISYDEDGHRWLGGRIVDGSDVRWIVVGIERAGASPLRMMTLDEHRDLAGYPPEAMVIGTVRYTLDKRGNATCKLTGDLGGLGNLTSGKRTDGTAERCRWWLYNAAGDDTMIVEQWGGDYRVLRGTKISDGVVELMPGS